MNSSFSPITKDNGTMAFSESYKPIVLATIIAKLTEKIIAIKMIKYPGNLKTFKNNVDMLRANNDHMNYHLSYTFG